MRPWYRFCRILCQAAFTFPVRVRVFGVHHVPRQGGVLLVSNHQSFLDPVLTGLAIHRELSFMARESLLRLGLLSRLFVSLNAFGVRRGTADVSAIKEALRRLKAGAILTVFPEGTRTRDGSVQPMHAGVVLLARRAQVPMVPTLILGAFECWPRTRKFPLPGPILVAYARPLRPDDYAQLDDEACIRTVRERILALQRTYERHPHLAAWSRFLACPRRARHL